MRVYRFCGVLVAASLMIARPRIAAAQEKPSFDVASVKLHSDYGGEQTTTVNDEAGAIHYSNVSLKSCILAAYNLQPSLLEGMDGHQPERYDIDAKSDTRATGMALMTMLRTLLEDRFQLKYHQGTREVAVYRLSATKNVKLQPAAGPDAGLDYSGGADPHLYGHVSPARLAEFLSGLCDRPFVDATGLQGVYDIRIEWKAGPNRMENQDALFAAIEGKLGLRVEMGTASVETMIIDHYQAKPSAN